ncbi:MAG: DNA-binding domain-containing protein [Thermoanaerobaculia bacterium]
MHVERSLDHVQRWMLEVITSPGSVRDGLECEPAKREFAPEVLPTLILPSATLTPERRIGIYHDMYLSRMVEALEFDYPGLSHFLGHARFHQLVNGYVAAHPSRSYTLNRLGDHLPDYIAAARELPRRALLAELARFELAITQVFDARRDEALDLAVISALSPDAWPDARFRTIAAMQLLQLDYPVDEYLQSVKQDGAHPSLRKAPRFLLVFRSDLAVKQVTLSKREWTMLDALREGLTLADSVDRLSRLRPSLSETELFAWFRDWTTMGLFRSVEVGKK